MIDHDILAALRQARRRALAFATRELVPQLEDDLRRLEACCAGNDTRPAFTRAFIDELARPIRTLLEAVGDLTAPLDDLPAHPADTKPSAEPAGEQPACTIDFDRFSKLKEISIVEGAIEVVVPLRD